MELRGAVGSYGRSVHQEGFRALRWGFALSRVRAPACGTRARGLRLTRIAEQNPGLNETQIPRIPKGNPAESLGKPRDGYAWCVSNLSRRLRLVTRSRRRHEASDRQGTYMWSYPRHGT